MERDKIIFLLVILILFKFLFSFSKSSPIDMPLFLAWSSHLAKNGFSDFYQTWKETDPYPPLSLYFLWLSGKIASFFDFTQRSHEFLIKFFPVLSEILGGFLIYHIAKRQKKEKLGFFLALLYCFNPAVFFNSSFWGQYDSFSATFLLFSIYLFEIEKKILGVIFFTLSFFIKPQAIFLAPLILFLILRDFSLKNIFLSLFFVLFLSLFLFFPFVKENPISFIISYHLQRFQQYPYATANAFNFLMMVGGQTEFDKNYFFKFSYRTFGLILTFVFQFLSIFLIFKFKKEPFYLYLSSFFSLFSSFFFLTRMHERYLIPSLIFLTTLLIWEKSLWRLLLFLSLAVFVNNYYIFWRSWYGTLNNLPYFVWIEKNDLIALYFSFITFLCFLYTLFFIFQRIFPTLKKIEIKLPSLFEAPSLKHQESKAKIFFIFLLIFLSFLTRFFMIEHPAQVVFDEVHYGKAVNGYLKREYFFTGHPPLGPELITLGAIFGKYKANFEFKEIGEKFTDNSYILLRAVPAFFGALIPLVLFFFLKEIGFSDVLAFFASLFLIFENSFLVQSRFILIDTFWIFFGFLGLTLFFISRKKNYTLFYLILSGIFFGLGAAVKWTALSFPLFSVIVFAFDFIKKFFKNNKREIFILFLKASFSLLFCFSLAYFIPFFIHFKVLTKPGPGDAFMSQEFLKGQKNLFEKFLELNKVSYETNVKGMKATHPYSSKFYTWPFLLRPIFYWIDYNQRIYFLGNPILWWSSTFAIFILFILFIFHSKIQKDKRAIFILLGYLTNTVPYLNVERVTFLYHYLPALIFAISSLVYLVSWLKDWKKAIFLILIFVIFSFLYFAPLSYGFPLSPEDYQRRIWLKTWI
jgi:Gpi18-like mannosyltransferase/4-amino-4-deoxy-L-arabinose transferase-like glycosyltransferase